MPRRRIVHDVQPFMEHELSQVDKFADDTSMIGFRYLHRRYKLWFRVLWVLLLVAFIGITVYQVFDRVRYYVQHPLTVNIVHETVNTIPLPKVLLCNKLEIKASAIAERDPHLLTALSQLYKGNGGNIDNDTFFTEYAKQTPTLVDAAVLARVAQSKDTDFIIGCFYKGNQECHVESVATPSGICYSVSPRNNQNITRPGPEGALTILVDVETHEIVPGFTDSPGIRVYLQDRTKTPSFISDGLHLSPGQTITIPVNDIYTILRDESQCNAVKLKHFGSNRYHQSECYWEHVYADIAKSCGCEPARSPRTRQFFKTKIQEDDDEELSEENVEQQAASITTGLGLCNVVQEFTCIRPTIEKYNLANEKLSEKCPSECEETSYATIMLGSPLDAGEYSAHLPSNWDEIKEEKLLRYKPAYEAIPKDRLEVVRGITRLSQELQSFLTNVTSIFDIQPNPRLLPRTCSTRSDGFNVLGNALAKLQAEEPFWRFWAVFAEKEVPQRFESAIRMLRSRLLMHKVDNPYLEYNISEIYEDAAQSLTNFTNELKVPLKVEGLGMMSLDQQETLVGVIGALFNETSDCVNRMSASVIHVQQLKDCRDLFDESVAMFQSAVTVRDGLQQSGVAGDFEVVVNDISHAVRSAQWTNPAYLANMQSFNLELQAFALDHAGDGAEHKKLEDLFSVRLLARRSLLEKLDTAIRDVSTLMDTRKEILERVALADVESEPVSAIHKVLECFRIQRDHSRQLRRHIFLRDEWLSRLTRYVKMTLAMTPGAEYDEVNLLYVKVYYAQLKKETVVQRQTFNLFVLLAEIGGTVGLYLGATVVTVLEIIVFFIEDSIRAAGHHQHSGNPSNKPSYAAPRNGVNPVTNNKSANGRRYSTGSESKTGDMEMSMSCSGGESVKTQSALPATDDASKTLFRNSAQSRKK